MKSKKDISDLIRDNQHKLDERPNPRAWKKLEERLDQHEGKGKKSTRILLYRRLAFAAAIAALVAVISILNTQTENDMAKMEANVSPQDQFAQGLEPVYSKENNDVRQVIEIQRRLKDRYANPIQEGTQTKKLLASNKVNTRNYSNTNQSSREAIVSNEKMEKPNASNVIIPNGDVSYDEGEVASTISIEASDLEWADAEVVEEVTVVLDDAIAEAAPAPVAIPAPPIVSEKKSKSRKKDAFSKNNKSIGIQNLNWMAGDWESKGKSLNILFLNNSDLVSLDFQIKEIGGDLFFVSLTDTYEFVKQFGTATIFEQKNKDQIILEKIDANQFSITLVKFSSGLKEVEIFTKK